MPGDLTNPEFMFPYHYDPRYEPGTNTFESRPLNINTVIQDCAKKHLDRPANKEEIQKAKDYLTTKNLDFENPGEQLTQEMLEKFFKMMKSAKKVAAKWMI